MRTLSPEQSSPRMAPRFATVEQAVAEIAAGRMVVVVDDEDRENEGDLIMAADFVEARHVNFMAKHARGWICLALAPERCDELGLELMARTGRSGQGTPFTVTIEARRGISTGISAADRARTVRVAADPACGPDDIVKGGHVSPLRARARGVLERRGHTEAAVDLARLAGCTPAGLICEVMNDDGTMARVDDLSSYCRRHGLLLLTIDDLVAYRRRNEPLVERVVRTRLPTSFGAFEAVGYRSPADMKEHVALVKGDVDGREDVLVRIHSECLIGDVFHAARCGCGQRLDEAMAAIERRGRGVLVYLARDGRGGGVGGRCAPADARDRVLAGEILVDLGVGSIAADESRHAD